jgi:hypothetical protein
MNWNKGVAKYKGTAFFIVQRSIHLQVTPLRPLCQHSVDTMQPSLTDASLSLSMNLILEAFMRALIEPTVPARRWRDQAFSGGRGVFLTDTEESAR